MSNVAAEAEADRRQQAERRLRLWAEATVVLASAPSAEIAAGISALNDAADAIVGAGLLPGDVTSAIVTETIDALFVRGADWLEPTWPELEIGRLTAGFAVSPPPTIERTSATTDLPCREWDITPVDYFERLVLRVVALVALGAPVGMINEMCSRLRVSADALGLPDADAIARAALRAVDVAVAASGHNDDTPDSVLIETVPLAFRLDVGRLADLQRWSDHWCLTITSDEPGKPAFWSATEGEGARAAGIPTGPGVLRFDPALAPSARAIALELVTEGRVHTFDVRW